MSDMRQGHLVCRDNARHKGTFYGCSNWPYCEHTQRPCPRVVVESVVFGAHHCVSQGAIETTTLIAPSQPGQPPVEQMAIQDRRQFEGWIKTA